MLKQHSTLTFRFWFAPFFLAISLVLTQILSLTLVAGETGLAAAYRNMCRWDCGAFARIAEIGYPATISYPPPPYSDLGHFPGLPLATAGLRILLPFLTNVKIATVLASQLAAVGFWTYFLRLAGSLKTMSSRTPSHWLATALVLSYPQAFLIVSGYSESVFLFGLLGMLHWSRRAGVKGFVLASLHGVVMGLARMVALPLCLLPLALHLIEHGTKEFSDWKPSHALRPLVIGSFAALGTLSYFAFGEIRYGHWDMYFRALESGWKMTADYQFVWQSRHYHLDFPTFRDFSSMNAFAYPLLSAFLLSTLLFEFVIYLVRGSFEKTWRAVFYAGAGLLWFFSAAGASHLEMQSMIRYGFCVYVMTILALLPQIEWCLQQGELAQNTTLLAVLVCCSISFCLEGNFGFLYMTGAWIG